MSAGLPPTARKEFERAVALFNEGRLATADGICTELLVRYPGDPEIAHFGGVLANRMGRYEVAVQRLSRCLQAQPQRAKAHAALAFAQEQLGRLAEARESFGAAIRAEPSFAQAYNGLGVTLVKLGNPVEALPYFERAIALDAASVEARVNLARALLDMGRDAAASQRFREAAALARHDDVVKACAEGLYQAGDLDASEKLYRALLARNSGDAILRAEFALVLESKGFEREAFENAEAAMATGASEAIVHNSYGVLLLGRGRFDEAAARFRKALALDVRFNEAALNLVAALRGGGHGGEARAEMLAVEPRLDANGLSSLAVRCSEIGESARCIELAKRAIALSPSVSAAHSTLATEFLKTNDLEHGWREHLYRPSRGGEIFEYVINGTYPPKLPASLARREVLILSEQGLGDMLLFLRYARPLADAGAKLHMMRLDPRLAPLVKRALAIDMWPEDRPVPAEVPAIWAGDLPLFVRPLTGSDVCPSLAIAPLPERVARMRERLGSSNVPRVGVAWRAGTPPPPGQPRKRVLWKDTSPRMLGEALAGLPLQFVSIQRRPAEGSTEEFEQALGAEVVDCSDVNEDLEDMLALLSLLDDYAGVSSTNIHFLAALGRTGRVLVPFPPDWRWQSSGESVWFEGFTTYRQTVQGDWGAALRELREDLTAEARA